jgi:hypothetical protein
MTATTSSSDDRQRLITALAGVPRDLAARMVCLLAIGAVEVVRDDYSQWPQVERIIFNATMLLFCKSWLEDDDLAEVINYGIQIDDLVHFTDDPIRFAAITDDVRARALRIFLGGD